MVFTAGGFAQNLSENEGRQTLDRVVEDQDVDTERNHSHNDDFPHEMSELNTAIPDPPRSMFSKTLAAESTTAFEDKNPETRELEIIGSKTEAAFLSSGHLTGRLGPTQTDIVQTTPFSSERRATQYVISVFMKNFWKTGSSLLGDAV